MLCLPLDISNHSIFLVACESVLNLQFKGFFLAKFLVYRTVYKICRLSTWAHSCNCTDKIAISYRRLGTTSLGSKCDNVCLWDHGIFKPDRQHMLSQHRVQTVFYLLLRHFIESAVPLRSVSCCSCAVCHHVRSSKFKASSIA